ncbi:MAG: TAT-variant-translocated molybdopterin oxidoreductase [Vicingaceae bacterium]
MSNNKKYWKGVEELKETQSFQQSSNKEFNEYLPAADFLGEENLLADSKTSRRDFLKYLGFGVTAASLAACETPVNKVIPYVVKTDKINPGVANYFASNYSDGYDFCDIVVKTREGRPIKIEGNKKSLFTKGGINARVNSSVLSLYDEKRYRAPQIAGEEVSWSKFDGEVKKELEAAISKGGKIRILTNTITSPSTLKLVSDFKAAYPDADIQHITYDAVSFSGMLEANMASFGKANLPSYDLTKAKSIVSIGADFMNDFPSSIQLTNQYAKGRNPEKGWMSKHFQFESSLSLSGSNADVRIPIKPSEQGKIAIDLYNYITGKGGSASAKVKKAGDHLLANKGASIVLAGANDKNIQLVVNAINQELNNYGKTLDINNPNFLKKGMDAKVAALVKEMNDGSVDALLVSDVDPVYSMPKSMNFEAAMAKVKTTVAFASRPTATSQKAKYIAAANHYLEAWNDANPQAGHYSLAQPTINPLFDTRQMQDCLMNWMGSSESYYEYIRKNWEATAFKMQSKSVFFDDFWNNCLHEGFFAGKQAPAVSDDSSEESEASVNGTASVASAIAAIGKAKTGDWELEFYSKVGIGDGKQAHNPWLQELPDPISKMTWDNYLAMNPGDAKELGFATEYGEQKNADTVNLTVNGVVYENVPVIAQPGQVKGTLSVALGYGQAIGKQNEIIGFNFYPAQNAGETYSSSVSFEATGNDYQVATTQTHQTVMGRTSVVRETNFDTYKNSDKDAYNPAHILATHDGPMNVNDVDLWAKHPVASAGHHWGMSIDLNSCIGCGSCVTSCNSENNVPVVGKDEVRRSREMHWMRIDRYFSSAEESVEESERSYGKMENPEDNPMVVHQPMMCQHCNHAPCETVCPVAATTHSNEGINQMTYNRCIGTRYCANNCPYKVRRFNWFSYQNLDKFADLNPSQDDLGRMVLNPDVTVRARGVMEKCSLCVQRIQTGKLDAKKEGRPVQDGDIQTACASACPTNAITFGDLNDKSSEVLAATQSNRAYRVIEEVGTQANVYYQVKVRNTETNIA